MQFQPPSGTLVMVYLFFLLAVLGHVLSAPLAAEECSSSVVLDGKTVKVTSLLSNHRCSLSHLFESFFEDDDVLTSTVGDGFAHKVCVGFLELVKVGETGSLLREICLLAKFTSSEEDYCQRSIDQNVPDIKKLINLSSSLLLPDGYRSALEILSTLDRVNCNGICGGRKTVLCDTVVELGKAFSMAKSSSITDKSSANRSHSDSAAAVNETRSLSTGVTINSNGLPKTENGTGSSKTQFNSTKGTTSKQLPKITGDHNSNKRFSSPDKNVPSQRPSGGQGQQLGTEQTNLYQQVSDPNKKSSSTYSARRSPNIPGQPNLYPPGRNPNVPGQPKWYPTERNPNIPGQPNLYSTGQNPNSPGQPNWYPAGRNPNIPGQPYLYPTERNPNIPGQPNGFQTGRNPNFSGQPKWYPTGRNLNIPGQPNLYPIGRNPSIPGQANGFQTGRNPNIPGQPNLYATERNPNIPRRPDSYGKGRNPSFPGQPNLYSTGRNQINPGQPLQYPAQNNQNIPGGPFQYPMGRKQNVTGQPAPHPSKQSQNQGTQGASTLNPGGSRPNQNTPVGSSNSSANFHNPKVTEDNIQNQRNPLEKSGPQNQGKSDEDVVSNQFNKTHIVHFPVDPENKGPLPPDLGGEKSSTKKGEELDKSGKKSESGTKPSGTEANDLQEGQTKDDLPGETNSDIVIDKEKQSIEDNLEQNKEGKDGNRKNDDAFVDVKKEQEDDTLTSFSEGAEANQMNAALEDKNNADSFQNFDSFSNDESEKGNKDFQEPLPNENEKSKFHADSDTPSTKPTSQKSTNPTTEEMSIDDEYHGYGTWHFVSIFLIVSVIAIVGYFFVHNRKKLRESLTGQIAGKGRRKNNYRPLSQQ
ncbi:PREDICTED: sporozoite surface protein 2-like isoform X2 [Amphimedon queenslandica]|uniref:BTB domain-containing protein n=1 Tax=Amphimedon queenslandica TaxID=400682 RepID=A0AAN0JIA4_AMPQE|nr:PREDICTED: sporozoite surface protein 2-like isoform X2 [Amphimedon queenslandica]|eukprot:XP_019856755.1 PREDICTED: sporozoite surface protein 2-like isoform X2 [Amphimedon queenslandica]